MGNSQLNAIKSCVEINDIRNFYIFHGVEDYIKNMRLKEIEKLLIDENFKSFNLEKFDQNNFNLQDFSNAIESLPAMAEKKLIIVRDFDLFKMKSDIKDQMGDILSDLPDYVCVIFDYASIEFKQDKRLKISNIIKKHGEIVDFAYLDQKSLNLWIKEVFSSEKIDISTKTCEYFTFICSMSMSNLSSEIAKLTSYCINEVTENDIDAVCSKVLEAKIFEITNRLLDNDVIMAQQLIDDLILLKTEEVSIAAVINSQFQRLYSAKLGIMQNKPDKFYMTLWGISSSYAIRMSKEEASKHNIEFLRTACNLTAKATVDIVSLNIEKSRILQLLIVKIGAINAKN